MSTSKYGPMLANRRRLCCDDRDVPCLPCVAYIAGVRDALHGSNLVECDRCGDVHDVRWHVAAGMVASDEFEATCDEHGIRHTTDPSRCNPAGPCRPCPGCARCRERCPDCDPATHVRVSVEGRICLVERDRFPGAQLWDLALYAAERLHRDRPGQDWEYRDNHGAQHGWDTHMQDFWHEDLHVVPRAVTGA